MKSFNFSKWNTILGWVAFAITLIVFSITVEPSLSFWDCGEYISTAAKLEVGHPPGAPLYQIIGAFFAMFAFNEKQIGLMVNMMSVFSGAFTVLFMFWSSTKLMRKVVSTYSDLNLNRQIAILGSSFIGALTLTFSDSFWFNATEAEVYSMATFLIAILFWLGLKWEEDMLEPNGNKWLLAISLVIGLSFGVHFMALLTIPALGMIYYFKHYQTITVKNFILANIVVVAVLLFIFKLLLPWTMALFGHTEVFMVNSFGLPFNSGTIFMGLLIISLFYYGLKVTAQNNKPFANTFLLCILFVFIGFSTWLMLPIRSNANVVINENEPSDAREVLAYYNREQYGSLPLFYGPQYTDIYAGPDQENPFKDKAPNYERNYQTGKYEIVNQYKNAEQNSNSKHFAILPRLWSTEDSHIENYITFAGVPEIEMNQDYNFDQDLAQYGVNLDSISQEEYYYAVGQLKGEVQKTINQFKSEYQQGNIDQKDYLDFIKKYGDYLIIEKPSTVQNFKFLFDYQFGYMYMRYLMWNFVGRQNDIQGNGDIENGNWLSGISFIDELRLGSQDKLPTDIKNNKGRNTYFFIPFILGLIGFLYILQRDKKTFYIMFVLFMLTGFVLKIYLNERPYEPRERDYALVGSFMIFAMWVGFGVFSLYETISTKIKSNVSLPIALGLAFLASPLLMAYQNWDDHDRSDRYSAVANAKAYLDSCEPNAILFTIGDNDTFPLWYMQEIENYRTDVRIVNTSLLMTDWYADQMKAKAYNSDPVPITIDRNLYKGDKLHYSVYKPKIDSAINVFDFLKFMKIENENTMITMQNGLKFHYYPTNKITIPVDKNKVIQNKVVSQKYYDQIVPNIDITIKGGALYQNRLMMIDIIANNNWKRPIYFSGGSNADDDYAWMKDYLQLDGMVYKLVPIKTPKKDKHQFEMGIVDTDKMYDIVMKWDWGNMESTKIYHDPETRKNALGYRNNLSRLMKALIEEGKLEKANKIADLAMAKMPYEYYGYYSLLSDFVEGYYLIDADDKARNLTQKLIKTYQEYLDYYHNMSQSDQRIFEQEIARNLYSYISLLELVEEQGDKTLQKQEIKTLEIYKNKFKNIINRYRLDETEEDEQAMIDSIIKDSLNQVKDTLEK
ncbi:MAG: protein O-mannosyl-transferase family [Flavobacterium sp.]